MITMTPADWTGFIGVSLLLLAFFLNLRGFINKDGLSYLVLNFAGAAIACFASFLLLFWPFIILEGCWALVSVYGIYGLLNLKHRRG